MSNDPKTPSFVKFLVLNCLWEETSSKLFQYTVLIGSNMLILAPLLRHLFLILPTTNITIFSDMVLQTTQFFMLKLSVVDEAGSEKLLISHILIWIYAFGFLVLLAFFARVYSKKQTVSSLGKLMLRIILQFHLCIGFTAVNLVTFNTLVSLQARTVLANTMNTHQGIIFVFNVVSLLINYTVGIFGALFSFDPFLSKNIVSAHSPNFQFFTFSFKAIMTALTVILQEDSGIIWAQVFVSVAAVAIRHFYLFKSIPYYNYPAMKICITLSTMSVVIAIVNLMTLILTKYVDNIHLNIDAILCVDIVIIVVSHRFWGILFHKLVYQSLLFQSAQMRTEDQVFRKFFAVRHTLEDVQVCASPTAEKLGQRNNLYFWGAYQAYLQAQKARGNTDSESIDIEKLTVQELRDETAKFARFWTLFVLKHAIENVARNNKLLILMINHLLSSTENVPTAIYYLAQLPNPPTYEGVLIAKFREKVQKRIFSMLHENKESGILDIKTFIDSEGVYRNFFQFLLTNTKNYMDFWTIYEENIMQVKSLFTKHKEIEKGSKQIQSYWTKHVENNKQLVGSLVSVYSLYLTLVRNRPVSGAKVLKKHQILLQQHQRSRKDVLLSQCTLNDRSIIIIHSSMSREKLGLVHDVSSHVCETLGWHQSNLVGKSINMILPGFMRGPHQQIMQHHLDSIKNFKVPARLDKILQSFVIDKKGFVVPCEVYLSIYPYVQDELIYASIMKVKETNEGLILVSEDGFIEGYNQNIGDKLNLVPGTKLHMRDVCKDYSELDKKLKSNTPFFNLDDETQDSKLKEHFVLVLKALESSNKKSFSYLVYVKRQSFCGIPFYILELTLDGEGDIDVDLEPFEDRATKGHFLDESQADIPTERVSEQEVTPYPIIKSLQTEVLATQRSDSQQMLLISPRFNSVYSPSSSRGLKSERPRINDLDVLDKQSSMPNHFNTDEKMEEEKEKDDNIEKILAKNFKTRDIIKSSVTAREHYNAEIEQLVNNIPRNRNLHLLRILGIIWILSIPFTLLGVQLQKNEIASLVNGNIQFTSQATLLLSKVIQMNRSTRFITIEDSHLFIPYKYGRETKFYLPAPILSLAIATNQASNSIRCSLNRIDPHLRDLAYSYTMPIIEKLNTGTYAKIKQINIFDFTTDLVSTGIRLGHTPVAQLNMTLSDVAFIENNTLNDFLVIWEQFRPLLVEDTQLKLRSQEKLVVFLWVVMFCMSVIVLVIFYNLIATFKKKRDHLLNLLLRLDNRLITAHMQKVQKFARNLEKGYVSSNIHEQVKGVSQREVAKVQTSSSTKKPSRKGINIAFYRQYVLMIVFLLLLWTIYMALYIATKRQIGLVSNKMNLLVESNSYYYQLSLICFPFYEYIQENETTRIRNAPIKEEMEILFNNMENAQDFFANTLLKKENGLTSNQTIYDLVQGNLCNVIYYTNALNRVCLTAQGGMMQKGIVGMNSMILSTLRTLITTFDNSQRSFTDMFNAINSPDLGVIESIQYNYLSPVYTAVDNLIRNSLSDDLDKYTAVLKWMNSFFAVECLTIGLLGWVCLMRAFRRETTQWFKMVRQVPWDILLSNKLLKTYLVKNNGIAESMKV